jgi:hypothetical protein
LKAAGVKTLCGESDDKVSDGRTTMVEQVHRQYVAQLDSPQAPQWIHR